MTDKEKKGPVAKKSKKPQLKNFIETNHHIAMRYHARNYQYITCFSETKYERIQSLFFNALVAAGGPIPLDAKYVSYKYFSEKIESLKRKKRLAFKDFAECFMHDFDAPNKITVLSKTFINDSKLPQFGIKKANLFIKELLMVAGNDIFDDDNEKYISHLIIPIDSVIRKVYRKLQKLKEESKIRDENIHEFARELFPQKPIFLDDLWFWGHFTFNKELLLSEANIPMVYTDKLLDEDFINKYKLITKLNRFIEIAKNH
jgi:hypothetical protein